MAPYFRVVPAEAGAEVETAAGATCIRIHPSAAFGDGSHETTQLCLLALGAFSRAGFRPRTVLDFGAGSGILAIAAALGGARVEAVELDPRAVASAGENARLNGVEGAIELHAQLAEPAPTFRSRAGKHPPTDAAEFRRSAVRSAVPPRADDPLGPAQHGGPGHSRALRATLGPDAGLRLRTGTGGPWCLGAEVRESVGSSGGQEEPLREHRA